MSDKRKANIFERAIEGGVDTYKRAIDSVRSKKEAPVGKVKTTAKERLAIARSLTPEKHARFLERLGPERMKKFERQVKEELAKPRKY